MLAFSNRGFTVARAVMHLAHSVINELLLYRYNAATCADT